MRPFEINITDICASTAAVFLQGFDGGIINNLRIKLIQSLLGTNLSFADRQVDIVHITLGRFTANTLSNPGGFVQLVEDSRNTPFGSILVRGIPLIEEQIAYLDAYKYHGAFMHNPINSTWPFITTEGITTLPI